MKDEYDFSNARRGAVVDSTGKTRITIFLDDDILAAFREQAAQSGKGYQTLIFTKYTHYAQSADEGGR